MTAELESGKDRVRTLRTADLYLYHVVLLGLLGLLDYTVATEKAGGLVT